MGETNRVVARFLDGTTLKGTTEDFFPNRPSFHLYVSGETKAREISCAKLKAVFFVKDLAGDAERKDLPGFAEPASAVHHGRKIAVRFKDGEILCGFTMAYTPERSGFFIAPANETGNNLRIYVLKHSTQAIAVGTHVDALEQQAKDRAA